MKSRLTFSEHYTYQHFSSIINHHIILSYDRFVKFWNNVCLFKPDVKIVAVTTYKIDENFLLN